MRKETVEITVLTMHLHVRVCVDVRRCVQAAGEDHGAFGFGPPEIEAHVEREIERYLTAQPYVWEAQVGKPIEPVQLSLPFDEPQ